MVFDRKDAFVWKRCIWWYHFNYFILLKVRCNEYILYVRRRMFSVLVFWLMIRSRHFSIFSDRHLGRQLPMGIFCQKESFNILYGIVKTYLANLNYVSVLFSYAFAPKHSLLITKLIHLRTWEYCTFINIQKDFNPVSNMSIHARIKAQP